MKTISDKHECQHRGPLPKMGACVKCTNPRRDFGYMKTPLLDNMSKPIQVKNVKLFGELFGTVIKQ